MNESVNELQVWSSRGPDWIDDMDTTVPNVNDLVESVTLISICVESLNRSRLRFEDTVAVAHREREVSAQTALNEAKERRKSARSLRERRISRKEVRAAAKRLENVLQEATSGRWREVSKDEVLADVSIAVDPRHPEMSGLISALHTLCNQTGSSIRRLTGSNRSRGKDWLSDIYVSLRAYSYFTQQLNRNFLRAGGNEAWRRTCNITSLAMVLRSLGFTPHHLRSEYRQPVTTVYATLTGLAKASEGLWDSQVAKLTLPDFLQLVAIQYQWEIQSEKPRFSRLTQARQIEKARNAASRVITNDSKVFDRLASRFGLRQYRVFSGAFDSLPSVGRSTTRHFSRQELKLRMIIASCLEHIFTIPSDAESIAELIRSAGLCRTRTATKLGTKIVLRHGPTTQDIEAYLSERLFPGGSTSIPEEVIDTANMLARRVVLDRISAGSQADSEGVRDRVATSQGHESVMQVAVEYGLDRSVSDILESRRAAANHGISKYSSFRHYARCSLLWLLAAELVHCHILGVAAYEEFAATMNERDFPDSLGWAKEEIMNEWRSSNEQIGRFRRSTGSQLKEMVFNTIKPLLEEGAAIVVLRAGHYVSLVDVDETGMVTNDPASGLRSDGSIGKMSRLSWRQASQLAFFRAFHVFFHPSRNVEAAEAEF